MQNQQEQQHADRSELAGQGLVPRGLVSHVPVSIISSVDSRASSSSSLSSLSSKEGSENGDTLSSNSRLAEINGWKSSNMEITPPAQDSTASAEFRKIESTKKRPFKKALIDAANMRSHGAFSHSEPQTLLSTSPKKKVRKLSNDSSTQATARVISPPLQQQNQQQKPMQSHLMLLAREEDEAHLSPLHVFVRKQIEVFTATTTELTEPAPGRKQPIRLHQVGLRCIHCRHLTTNTPQKSRVKRAVCYPSSVGRIYHSVSDMKFDHFSLCKELPPDVRNTFESLKAESKRSNGKNANGSKKEKKTKTSKKGQTFSSTAQYYRTSASQMGLMDSPRGIIYVPLKHNSSSERSTNSPNLVSAAMSMQNLVPQQPLQALSTKNTFHNHLNQPQNPSLLASQGICSTNFLPPDISHLVGAKDHSSSIVTEMDHKNLTVAMNSSVLQSLLMNAILAGANAQKSIDAASKALGGGGYNQQANTTSPLLPSATTPETSTAARQLVLPLASPEDAGVLNPLHCFVRKHVELFEADAEALSAPAPGRKVRVTLGQVGIRCVHCAKKNAPAKERIKRAVCYPPSIDGIYHSVSNMKFDHFGICPNLPAEAKAELAALRTPASGRRQASKSTKGSGKRSSGSSNTNTGHYYRDSAIAKGLVNTEKGIRFGDVDKTPSRNSTDAASAPATTTTTTSVSDDSTTAVTGLPNRSASPSYPTGMSVLMMAAASHATRV